MTQESFQDESYGSGMAFFTGLVAGAIIGVGLGMLFAPRRGSELRKQVTDSATKVSQGVSKTVDDLSEQGRVAYDHVRDVANRAGTVVERMTGEAVKAADAVANSETAKAAVAAARSMYAGADRG
jgi:gas vesicle protein